jgi:predicted homoserine dehydrogenase-like protein
MNVEDMATKKMINVGVIGCGRIGLVHLEAICKAPGVKAVIVSNPTISKAEAGKYRPRKERFFVFQQCFPMRVVRPLSTHHSYHLRLS